MYMTKYPCVYMRGGTSKAIFFHEKDLPENKETWDEIFLKVMGTPDVKSSRLTGWEVQYLRQVKLQ